MTDLLEGCVAELLEQFPGNHILAVVATARRAGEVQARFAQAPVMVVPACSPMYAGRFDAVVTEMPRSEVMALSWMANVLPTRMAPGAVVYHVDAEA